ncbi:MAG TPA: hypothetical protein VG755_24775 [Nannocystaceae bacterium]|nr:hypothetical protein [Nannocystaceae bacterium]
MISIISILGAAVPACADEAPEVPPIVWEGEHLRFGTSEDLDAVCAGTLPYADDLVEHMAHLLGAAEPTVDFYWVPDGLDRYCVPEQVGCTVGSSVFSQFVLHQHEFVHALRDHGAYRPLEEGLAELYGDDWEAFYHLEGDVIEMFETHDKKPLEGPWYPLAGFFASFLRHHAGTADFLAFVEATNKGDSWDVTERMFTEFFDATVDDLVADQTATYPRCNQTIYRDNSFECSRPGVTLPPEGSTEVTTITVAMGCGDADVLGPRRGERWVTMAVDNPAEGVFEIGLNKVGGTGPGHFESRRCDQSCADGRMNLLTVPLDYPAVASQAAPDEGEERWQYQVCLPGGIHLARFAVEEDDTDTELIMWLRRTDGSTKGCDK